MTETYFIDHFEDDKTAGLVIGSENPDGVSRKGVDLEKVIGIDNGALRFEPLQRSGWARCGIAYGPYQRQNGLLMAVSIINGHNTAQSGSLFQSYRRRLVEWLRGGHMPSVPERVVQFLLKGPKRRTFKLWRRWWHIQQQYKGSDFVQLDENLALGWFPNEVPADPRQEGNAFVVHATGAENGELWARINEQTPPLIRGLQNIPIYYIVILRERGAAYYAAAVPETSYLPAAPLMRPLAIDIHNQENTLYAGLYQAAMGQIGFRADTRVRGIQVAHEPALASWYGTASTADTLTGQGSLENSHSETGETWQVIQGAFERTPQGCKAATPDNLAVLYPPTPPGLIHLLLHTGDELPQSVKLLWRFQDPENYWLLELGTGGNRLAYYLEGQRTEVAADEQPLLARNSAHSLQLLDYGRTIRLLLDGKPICGTVHPAEPLQDVAGLGIGSCGAAGGWHLTALEAHPRQILLPESVKLKSQWKHSDNRRIVVRDDFSGQSAELAGRETPIGGKKWRREIGVGSIQLNGSGSAVVQATAAQPNPGRTIYTIPWDNPTYADLELEFIPPGDEQSPDEKCRIGLAFIQDNDNYLTVSTYLDIFYKGSSFAFFYNLRGFEELYDAIWSNVGRTVGWGVPVRARVIMDGVNMAILLNGEAVLYRSLTDVYPDIHTFSIKQVGIVVNWEWGDDTGTIMNEFIAADHDK